VKENLGATRVSSNCPDSIAPYSPLTFHAKIGVALRQRPPPFPNTFRSVLPFTPGLRAPPTVWSHPPSAYLAGRLHVQLHAL